MKQSFEETLIAVWRQTLVGETDVIKLGSECYSVTRSKAKRLRQVAFVFEGNTIMGTEQTPKTKSRWPAYAVYREDQWRRRSKRTEIES
jgi:hypothetical protein